MSARGRRLTERQRAIAKRLQALLPRLIAGDLRAWGASTPDDVALEAGLARLLGVPIEVEPACGPRLASWDLDTLSALADRMGVTEERAYGALSGLVEDWFRDHPERLRDGLLSLPKIAAPDMFELLDATEEPFLYDSVCIELPQRFPDAGLDHVEPDELVRVLLRDPEALGEVARRLESSARDRA